MKKILTYMVCFTVLVVALAPASLAAVEEPRHRMLIRDEADPAFQGVIAIDGGEFTDAQLDELFEQAALGGMNAAPRAVACNASPTGNHNWKRTTKAGYAHYEYANGTCKTWWQWFVECSYCHGLKLEGTKRDLKTHTAGSTTCKNAIPPLP